MNKAQELLQAAETLLTNQLKAVQQGGVPRDLYNAETALLQVLRNAEEQPEGAGAWQARGLLEDLHGAAGNAVRQALTNRPGPLMLTPTSNYCQDLNTLLHYVRHAKEQAAQPVAPQNREGWTLTDWHAKDSNGLAVMSKANTPQFAQLMQQHYGHPTPPASSQDSARHPAPAVRLAADEPAPKAEPVGRSLLNQLPKLGELLTVMLTMLGEALAELPGDRFTGIASQMLGREQALLASSEAATNMVAGTETASLIIGAESRLAKMSKDEQNPVRLAAQRQATEPKAWANYRSCLQHFVSGLLQAEKAAGELTTGNYAADPPPKGREGWTLQKWMEKDPEGLQRLREENPNLFRQLYHDRYGIDPG